MLTEVPSSSGESLLPGGVDRDPWRGFVLPIQMILGGCEGWQYVWIACFVLIVVVSHGSDAIAKFGVTDTCLELFEWNDFVGGEHRAKIR